MIMENVLNEILKKLNSLEQGQQELRHGQQTLEQGQQELRHGQQTLEQTQQELRHGQQTLEQDYQELRHGQQTLEQGQQELRTNIQKIESKVDKLELRMEEEVFNKIGALLNGHSLRGDQIEKLRKHLDERLDNIETDTRYLVARVARLEKLAK